jgi:cytochrome c553
LYRQTASRNPVSKAETGFQGFAWIPVLVFMLIGGRALGAEPPSYTKDAKALLGQYCTRCHNAKKQEGGVDLASFADDAAALGKRNLWKHALDRVAAGEMPPEDAKQLSAADKEKLTKWLAAASEYLDCALARRDPGPPLLRRLSHAEYVLTVADLLGVHPDARNDLGFPVEEPSEGRFDNLSANLRLSPAMMEKYFAAADKIADLVFVSEGAKRRLLNPQPGPKLTERDAAKEIVTNLVRRAFRRPAEKADVDRLLAFYDKSRTTGGSHEDGIRACIKPVLVSPKFLFRVEEDRPGSAVGVPVDDFELAVRLSYFLWGTMPDETLFRAAAEKKLSDPAGFQKEVTRLLQHDRARHLTEALAENWLMLRQFPKARPSIEFFPTFHDELKRPMVQEVRLMVDHLRTADRPVTDLLDSDYTFVNEALAKHYGIGGVSGNQMRKVSLTAEHHRGGLLGMGGVLAMTSHTFRTSPTQRGKYVLDVLLGTPPPPPPANAGVLKNDDPKKKQPLTFREQLAQHATQPACAGCHKKIDPLGFALDNFNAIGEWRTGTKDVPLDVSGELPGGEKIDGFAGVKAVLLKRKDQFTAHMIAKVLELALGRELDGQDECTIREVLAEVKKADYRFPVMINEVVKSVPFRQRRSVKP